MTGDDSLRSRPCPCGSGTPLERCCDRYISGSRIAPTAEALMRSRYAAYVGGHVDYLRRTWHSSTRPKRIDTAAGPNWTGLCILGICAGGEDAQEGSVEFTAHYLDGRRPGVLHETSRFVREEGRWVYLDGDIHAPAAEPNKVGRNDRCPCGSGRKFKRCCGNS